MLKIKKLSKTLIKNIFVLSLLLYFYLSAVSEFEIFLSNKANIIFNSFNVFINTIFMFILLLVLTIEFSKFMYYIEINIGNTKNLKWVVKRDNLVSLFKLAVLTFPFALIYLVKFFTKQTSVLEFEIVILCYASAAVLLIITLITMYIAYSFVVKRKWINTYEKEYNFLIESIYFNSMFLDIINFDQNNYFVELKDEINIFLASKNEENDILFTHQLAEFLNNTKKATTPPLI
ncbi:hypothetical protein [Spiroplasma cantharicola]|uniref:Uncharacterized protein n=1 Tax=Spiroplasma cantharicola TaxID=362837 RepID=A0A0M4JJ83_9MOLU|nr:hypothetical protein [Spiroplasma cantharicola]ALD66803.1 hypothetical protein SCANT_v1c08970 [Spiroplasma cantharicola]